MESKEPKKSSDDKQININVPSAVASGQYANVMINNFSKEEFVLDFALIQPHTSTAVVNSRVILSPRNTKKLIQLLSAQVKEYESKCGPISDENPSGPVSFSFN